MPTQFRDASGQERLLGTIYVPGATVGDVFTVQANGSLSPAPGGGSQPGIQYVDFLFTEVADSGVYTATFDVEAGTRVLSFSLMTLAAWAADSLTLAVHDPLASDSGGYVDGADLLSTSGAGADLNLPYIPANDYANGYGDSGNIQTGGGGIWHAVPLLDESTDHALGVYYPIASTVTMEITSVNGSPVVPTGQTVLRFMYAPPVTPTDATFA